MWYFKRLNMWILLGVYGVTSAHYIDAMGGVYAIASETRPAAPAQVRPIDAAPIARPDPITQKDGKLRTSGSLVVFS